MPFSRLRLVALCDSGLGSKGAGRGRSRAGNAVGAADWGLLVGEEAYVNILTLRSRMTARWKLYSR
eukprot:5146839-Pyramimonas_sp.AAC.1